jgi:hypothetical protein
MDGGNPQDQAKAQMKAYSQVVKKAWADPEFKKRLMGDPATVLGEEGFTVPSGTKVNVVENGTNRLNFVLPQDPGTAPLPFGEHTDLPFQETDLPFHDVGLPFQETVMLPFHNVALLPFMDPASND